MDKLGIEARSHVGNTVFPLDLYSLRRLTYNIFIYFNYTLFLVLSFFLAILLTSMSGMLDSHPPDVVLYALILMIITKFFVYNFFNFKRFTLNSMTLYDVGKTLFLIVTANTFMYIEGVVFNVEFLEMLPVSFWITDAVLNYLFILGFHMVMAFYFASHGKHNGLHFSAAHEHGGNGNGDRREKVPAVIVGAGDTGQTLHDMMARSDHGIRVEAFVDDDTHKIGKSYGGKRIYGPIDDIAAICRATERAESDCCDAILTGQDKKRIRSAFRSESKCCDSAFLFRNHQRQCES